jgi:hypothetical protein
LGSGYRGPLARAAQPRRRSGESLWRGDRTAGPHSPPRGPSPRPPSLRRVAAARAAPPGRAGAAAHGVRDVHCDGIEAFAGRAERELLATGERVRKRSVETREDSPSRSHRSRASPAPVSRTRRSASGCSSASTRSPITYARCSTSSTSPRAANSSGRCPTATVQVRWRSRRPAQPSSACAAVRDAAVPGGCPVARSEYAGKGKNRPREAHPRRPPASRARRRIAADGTPKGRQIS